MWEGKYVYLNSIKKRDNVTIIMRILNRLGGGGRPGYAHMSLIKTHVAQAKYGG